MNLDTVEKRDAARRRLRFVEREIIRLARRKITPQLARLIDERDAITLALREKGQRV